MTPKLAAAVGTWGRPPDTPAKVAVALAVVLAVVVATGRGRSLLGLGPSPLPRRLFLWLAAFSAALLSIFYVAHYLRGGPRIIDATTYFLQGRALASGSVAWSVPEPTASFRGRFLLFHDGAMGGIFPPGYPMLLAAGFALGAPMVVGPVLAAAIVLATHRLARTLAEDAAPVMLVEPIARAAALLSIVSAALRYHTADTMSHGATALGVTLALDLALRSARERARARPEALRFAWLAGLAVGAVAATRPVSALPIAVVVAFALRASRPAMARALLGALPGLALLALAQHAVTGTWLASSQRAYYAVADGPPGCFRWGFGAGTGCLSEHEDFVLARLPRGYGPVEALGTTLRRLHMHLGDALNVQPLALLPLAAAARAPGSPRPLAARLALGLVGVQVLAYAPFYFDGNYPGGGARFFADVLPVEHALAAVAVARLAPSRFGRAAVATIALAALGFGVHAVFDHVRLAERDGGRPMFEPDVVSRMSVKSGLVFVDTDHGFGLGHDPDARANKGVVVARLRGDDRDWLVFDALGRPPTWTYRFERAAEVAGGPPAQATVTLVPWAPTSPGDTFRFEAEAEWPPLAQRGAFGVPRHADPCASQGRALVVTPVAIAGEGDVTLSLPVPGPARYVVTARVVHGAHLASREAPGPATTGALEVAGLRTTWGAAPSGCADLTLGEAALAGPSVAVVVTARGGPVALDKLGLRRVP